jgi:hypothetical protein
MRRTNGSSPPKHPLLLPHCGLLVVELVAVVVGALVAVLSVRHVVVIVM